MNGENILVSYGLLSEINEENGINHKCNIDKGSSGSPILSLKNNKLIGIHYGLSDKYDFNKGTLIIYAIIEFNKKENKLTEITNSMTKKEPIIENPKIEEHIIEVYKKEEPLIINEGANKKVNSNKSEIENIYKISKENNKNINIIYYDENVNKPGMDIINDCCNLTMDTNGSIILVNDMNNLDLLLKYLQKYYPLIKFFFIINGRNSNEVINFIKKNNYISLFINACIYTHDIKKYSSIKKNIQILLV